MAILTNSGRSAIARYDNESNGSYLVRGMNITCLDATEDNQLFTVNEGKAHVNGYEIELAHSLRVRFDNEIDLQTVNSDPYLFEGDFEGKMTVHLNYTPLASVISVSGTVQKTANITHGSYSGALDPLPATSIHDTTSKYLRLQRTTLSRRLQSIDCIKNSQLPHKNYQCTNFQEKFILMPRKQQNYCFQRLYA
jgi:hypothetical protein